MAVLPTAPDVGDTLSPAVTVKLVAEVAELPEASVTTTLCAPAGTVGMVNVTVDEPFVPVVPPAVMVAVVPPTLTVNAEVDANPCAVIVALILADVTISL